MYDLLKAQIKKAGYTKDFDLASLIEACGTGFNNLGKDKKGWFCNMDTSDWYITEYGAGHYKPLEEAVSNLWLALQEQRKQ